MNILQIPIIDEFSASSKSKRTAEFAAEKGLGRKILAEHLALIVVPFQSPPQFPIQRLSLCSLTSGFSSLMYPSKFTFQWS
ncbi:hypothetical protein BS47DRAFT_558320 [Hydnum rufescens UP504]|uniref:Uncharacterized protein n=1 Tax=Hydnum rufescens UP504 TaxID=1448309 RepID=A0A9P6AHB5_9AGAM|nr:hypothetical protein BS47DRAFT_558320 [Hydnum rufescens UP504]